MSMFEIQPLDVDVPTELEPSQEFSSIINEYSIGHALREVALFRLWRMWRQNRYTEILGDSLDALPNQPHFSSFGDIIKFLSRQLDISRSKIYARLKTYSLLMHLGYTDAEMVSKMASKPGLYDKVMHALFSWDQEARVPTGMKTDAFGESPFDPETIGNVRAFVEELESADSIGDALSMLFHDVLGKPKIVLRFDGSNLVLDYTSVSVDAETGDEYITDWGTITFSPEDAMPNWIIDELRRKYAQKEKQGA